MEAIKNVVDHLKLTTFTLSGNSMGGDVAWHFALAYPDSLENMILVNAAGLSSWENEVKNLSFLIYWPKIGFDP